MNFLDNEPVAQVTCDGRTSFLEAMHEGAPPEAALVTLIEQVAEKKGHPLSIAAGVCGLDDEDLAQLRSGERSLLSLPGWSLTSFASYAGVGRWDVQLAMGRVRRADFEATVDSESVVSNAWPALAWIDSADSRALAQRATLAPDFGDEAPVAFQAMTHSSPDAGDVEWCRLIGKLMEWRGSELLLMLAVVAMRRRMSLADVTAATGLGGEVLGQLYRGVSDVSQISREVARALAAFLSVPVAVVWRAAGVLGQGRIDRLGIFEAIG